jgi:hypothetical protein
MQRNLGRESRTPDQREWSVIFSCNILLIEVYVYMARAECALPGCRGDKSIAVYQSLRAAPRRALHTRGRAFNSLAMQTHLSAQNIT